MQEPSRQSSFRTRAGLVALSGEQLQTIKHFISAAADSAVGWWHEREIRKSIDYLSGVPQQERSFARRDLANYLPRSERQYSGDQGSNMIDVGGNLQALRLDDLAMGQSAKILENWGRLLLLAEKDHHAKRRFEHADRLVRQFIASEG